MHTYALFRFVMNYETTLNDRIQRYSDQTVRWDIPKEGGGVNDYMELLVKETVTLHKVLSRYLSVSVVEVRSCLYCFIIGLI